MNIAMINDRLVPENELPDHYFDRGLYFGDGVYEVIRSYDSKIFALDEHLARLSNSLKAVHITKINIDTIRQRIQKAFSTAEIPNAKIYLHITRGCQPREHNWTEDLKPNFFLTVTPLPDSTKEKRDGIAVSTHPDWRWKRCDIKSLNLLANVLARADSAQKGCDEAIFVDDAGFITEGASSCFFAVFGQTLQTAPLTANILPSITRKYVIKTAEQIALAVVEESFTPKQAVEADELFIAVTTRDIVPVVKFDNTTISNGFAGKITKSLQKQFLTFTK